MTPHQLGQSLRSELLRQRQHGQRLEPKRLQAVIHDLCAGDHERLVGPLQHLVLSPPFASAAAGEPPLADPRVLSVWNEELALIYAPALCAELRPLLRGLLGLPAADPSHLQPSPLQPAATQPSSIQPSAARGPGAQPASANPSSADPSTAKSAALAAPPVAAAAAAPRGRGDGQGVALVVFAFLSGVLLMLVAGMALWIAQQRSAAPGPPAAVSADGSPPPPPSFTDPEATPSPPPAAPPDSSAATAGAEAAADTGAEAAAEQARRVAQDGIKQLYAALSARDHGQAQALLGAGAADQFQPGFFDQFKQVEVGDLKVLSQSGSQLELEGVVTFIKPDASRQSELRHFRVEVSGDRPQIVASHFERVI